MSGHLNPLGCHSRSICLPVTIGVLGRTQDKPHGRVLLAGSLYEGVFAPLMAEGSPAANSLSWLVGTGPARGMGLLLVVVVVLSVGLAVGGYSYRRLRYMEDELPDAIPDAFIAADKDELQALADRQFLGESV